MRSAVVIGASGGIGSALLNDITFSGTYERVFALSRSPSVVPKGVQWVPIDVTDERSVSDAAAIVGASGPIGLLIVASGILHNDEVSPEKTIQAISPSAFELIFSVNAFGPALVAKHFMKWMQRDGRAVFAALSARVGSIEDNRLGGWYSYRASKAALNQILRTLAIEFSRTHPQSIVVGLHPGTVLTGLSQPFRPTLGKYGVFSPAESALNLLKVIGNLQLTDTGGLIAWDGRKVPF